MEDRIRNSALKIFLLIIENPEIIGTTHMEMIEQITAIEMAADFSVILATLLEKAITKKLNGDD